MSTVTFVCLCLLLLTPSISIGRWWFLTPEENDIKNQRSRQRKLINTIDVINALNITKSVAMLEADGGYRFYLNNNFTDVSWDKPEPFNEFVNRYNINMIVISHALKNNFRFINNSEFQKFLDNPDKAGFQLVKIPGTKSYLLIKNDLIENVNAVSSP